jgi:hypothetical protein
MAQQRAQQVYNSIIQHEMKLTARLPADNLLTAQSAIRVGDPGKGTAFDQVYFPRVVTRTMSWMAAMR